MNLYYVDDLTSSTYLFMEIKNMKYNIFSGQYEPEGDNTNMKKIIKTAGIVGTVAGIIAGSVPIITASAATLLILKLLK